MPLLIVNHHYFREAGPGRGIYPTTPAELRASVTALRTAGWRIGTEADLTAAASGGGDDDDRVCVLTFDDGLKEQLAALALLRDLEASAVCFVPTAPLEDPSVLDVHKLHQIRAALDDDAMAERLDREFGLASVEFDEPAAAIQYRYDSPVARRVKYFLNFVLDPASRAAWTTRTFCSMFGDERAAASALYMNAADLRTAQALGAVIGSHAHSHVPLASLDAGQLGDELGRSRSMLTALTGGAPAGVSYPYGGESAVSPAVFAAARDAGYRYGLTMRRAVNRLDPAPEPLALARIDARDLGAYLAGEPA